MAWTFKNNWISTDKPDFNAFNAIAYDISHWGDDVNAGTYALSNLGTLTFSGSGYINSNVGIGAVPTRRLHIAGVNQNPTVLLADTGTTGYPGIVIVNDAADVFQLGVGGSAAASPYTRVAFISGGNYVPLTFITAGAERMRIDSSGNVGIGKTPGCLVDSAGIVRSTGVGNVPATGQGLEMVFSGGIGYLQSIDRAGGPAYLPLAFSGSRYIFSGCPTSATGLPSGAIWRDAADSNRLKMVP